MKLHFTRGLKPTESIFDSCNLCPRKCGASRGSNQKGLCGASSTLRVARAARHDWEEPCISGDKGSGAIFFSGCPLGCVFCQNREISRDFKGKDISIERLREIIRELEDSGVHNINLVTAGHFTPLVIKAIEHSPKIPVIWNSSAYESVYTLKSLEGRIQIYLPDLKYSDNALAKSYSNAPDYFETATRAILEMYRQVGPYRLDDEGIMQSGVIIRHLILPNAVQNSYGVLEWVADTFAPGEVMLSLMSQYTPCGDLTAYPEIERTISKEEYDLVESRLYALGIEDGFVQDLVSAESSYIPDFDLEGV